MTDNCSVFCNRRNSIQPLTCSEKHCRWAKDKSPANNEEATSPEFVENTLIGEGTESTALQNPDTSTKNSDLQAEKCKVVTKDKDSNSLSYNSANISCNFESKQEQDKDASKHTLNTQMH